VPQTISEMSGNFKVSREW